MYWTSKSQGHFGCLPTQFERIAANPAGGCTLYLWYTKCIDVDEVRYQRYVELLQPDEFKRMNSFRSDDDKRRYVIAKALLRTVLSPYIGVEPAEIKFIQTKYGRPELCSLGSSYSGVSFNISHSADLVVAAVSFENVVGVDVELITPLKDVFGLSEVCMGRREKQSIGCANPEDQSRRFLDSWTLKESVVKAEGLGLSIDISKFEIIQTQQGSLEIYPRQLDMRWWLFQLELESEYTAAVCALRHNSKRPLLRISRILPLGDERMARYQLIQTN